MPHRQQTDNRQLTADGELILRKRPDPGSQNWGTNDSWVFVLQCDSSVYQQGSLISLGREKPWSGKADRGVKRCGNLVPCRRGEAQTLTKSVESRL